MLHQELARREGRRRRKELVETGGAQIETAEKGETVILEEKEGHS